MPLLPKLTKRNRTPSPPSKPASATPSTTMSAQVEYRQLGKSGLRVSVPVLGCMSFGSDKWFPWVLNEDKAFPVMKAAWDAGVNTFDTANMYSNGESERVIAKFIKKYNIPRRSVVILSKIFWITSDDDSSVIAPMRPDLLQTAKYVNQGGLSRVAIFTQVADTLARLETDYIDLLQIHDHDPNTSYEETMKALNDLIVAGKVRYLGASNVKAWQVAEMNAVAARNGWTQFTAVQVEHSLLYRTWEVEMLAYCLHKGIGVLSYAPLMDGHLARPVGTRTARSKTLEGTFFEKKLRPTDEEIVRRVQQVAQTHGWSMAQVALAWSATKVTSPIIGANTAERVGENIIAGKSLSAEEIKSLEEPYEFRGYRY